jgi:glycosyltransferase involved in cell wall biosynthesis
MGSVADNFSNRLFKKLSNLKVDILLQDELNHSSLFWINRKLRQRVSFPIISIVHMVRSNPGNSSIWKPFYRWVETKYLDSVDGFVFNSRHTKRLVESMTKRKPNVVATPGGDRFGAKITDAEIRTRSRRPGPLSVIMLGNLTRNKGAHLLIEAAVELELDSVYVILAGRTDIEPGYVDGLRKLVVRSGLEGWVHFAGHVEGKMLEAMLATSHVLAVPSAYEGFGIAYLEGLGFGLPAIGMRAGGVGEIIQHSKNGYLIAAGDVDLMARTLKRLHEDRQLLARMSLSARRNFHSFPTWKESMESIHKFLNSYNQTSPLINSPRRKK